MAMRLAPQDERQIQMADDAELADFVRASAGPKRDGALMEQARRTLQAAQDQRIEDERDRLHRLREHPEPMRQDPTAMLHLHGHPLQAGELVDLRRYVEAIATEIVVEILGRPIVERIVITSLAPDSDHGNESE